ncbi:MAG: YggS family pyridoxal phosphate-dependent enzyme [Acidobacteriota bacterium]
MPDTLSGRLERIRGRIESACRRAGRDPDEVTLIAVSKRQPLTKLREALDAGHRSFGENQVQEARAKAPELPSGLDWHMIGPLQSNKVKPAVGLFDTFHAVDREKIVRALAKEAKRQSREVRAFLEVNLGDEPTKHGFGVEDFESRVRPLAEHGISFVGLMAIPPIEPRQEDTRGWFRKLRTLRDQVGTWPEWRTFEGLLSMGMSGDFEIAIEEGATHVRVGTSIFGPRPT